MPASYLMTWEPKHRRWAKMYKGHRHSRSCKQLAEWCGHHVVETKEGSYQIANAWWLEKLAEIQGQTQKPIDPRAEYRAVLEERREWARMHGDSQAEEILSSEISGKPRYVEDPTKPGHFFRLNLPPAVERYGDKPESIWSKMPRPPITALNPNDPVWKDRLARQETPPVPEDLTISVQITTYLGFERDRVSLYQYDQIRQCLERFRTFAGATLHVNTINENKIEQYFVYLRELEIGEEYKQKHLVHMRSFVTYLAEKRLIPLPLNLKSKKFVFKVTPKAISIIPIDDVKAIVREAKGQLKLHLLLMLNCGMTQVDISDLHPSEVEWTEGRIIRKRSKTSDEPNVPVVNYKLWQLTWELLQEHRSDSPDHVLLTQSGTKWVQTNVSQAGKVNRTDCISEAYGRLKNKLRNEPIAWESLKHFRKTSASLIGNHPEFARLVTEFLGHSPESIADIHYVRPSVSEFDRAVEWLGQQYGF